MRAFNGWTNTAIALSTVSVAIFFHAYGFETFNWEMYVASMMAVVALAVSVVAFRRRRENRVIAAICATVALIVVGHSVTELFMAYAFTGHMP